MSGSVTAVPAWAQGVPLGPTVTPIADPRTTGGVITPIAPTRAPVGSDPQWTVVSQSPTPPSQGTQWTVVSESPTPPAAQGGVPAWARSAPAAPAAVPAWAQGVPITPIPDPRTAGPAGATARGIGLGYLAGINSAPLGLAQLVGRGVQALTGYGGLANWAAQAAAKERAEATAAPYGNLGYTAGTILNPLYAALPGSITGSALADAALTGAVTGAAQPVLFPTDYWRTKEQQAATGAALGSLLGGVSHVASQLARSPQAALARQGVRLATTDILPEHASVTAAKVANVLPGRFSNAAQMRRALQDYQRVIYRWVLDPIGAHYGNSSPVGRDGIRIVQKAASDAYDRALGNRNVALPAAGFLSPAWLSGAEETQAAGAVHALGLAPDFNSLDQNAQERVLNVVRKELIHPLRVGQEGNSVSARALKQSQSDLRDAAVRLMRSDDEHMRDAGLMLRDVSDRITGVIASANPELAADLRAADATWHRLSILEAAVPSHAARKGVDETIVSPRQILDAMHGSDTSARHSRWIAGELPYQRMFLEHLGVLSEPGDTSLLGLEMGLGALGGGGYMASGLPGVGLALGGSTLPFTRSGSALARALAFNPAVAASIRTAIAPTAAAAGQATAAP